MKPSQSGSYEHQLFRYWTVAQLGQNAITDRKIPLERMEKNCFFAITP
jgi:hypothetical protein